MNNLVCGQSDSWMVSQVPAMCRLSNGLEHKGKPPWVRCCLLVAEMQAGVKQSWPNGRVQDGQALCVYLVGHGPTLLKLEHSETIPGCPELSVSELHSPQSSHQPSVPDYI